MKFNRYFIFVAFFMLILSVSAVNAADNIDINDDSASDLINTAENVSPDSIAVNKNWTVDEFLNDYNTIQDNDVVLIQNGTGMISDTIVLSQNNITIFTEGNVIFDGQGKNIHFEITGSNVLIKGITFKNFTFTGNGGAILWNGDNGTLSDSNFINNSATDNGGAVYWNNANGTVNGCVFTNNTATNGGAIYWYAPGSMINCSFVNDQWVKSNGIYAQDNLTIEGGNGIVDVVTLGTLSGISITVLNNETQYLSPNQEINITGKIMSGDLTIVDETIDSFKFYIDGVEFTDKATQISNNGEYFIPYTSNAPGTVLVGANYTKSSFTSKYKNATLIFREDPNLNAVVENITYGSNATVDVSINSEVTGKANIFINGTEYEVDISEGKATLILSNLAAGNYTVAVSYAGDSKFTGAEINTDFTVSKASPDLGVVVDNVTFGSNVTVEVSVNPAATGKVNVTFNGTVYEVDIVDGKAVLVLSDLGLGNYAVAVSYAGDGNFTSMEANGKFSVTKFNPDLNVAVDDVTVGSNVTVNVSINPEATGKVNITINGTTYEVDISEGKATLILSNLTIGNYAVAVSYAGDGNFTGAEANGKFSVTKFNPDLNVAVDDVTVGSNVTVNVSINPEATGKVNVTFNGTVYEVDIVDGKAVLVLSDLTVGNYTVIVYYGGNDKFNSAIANAEFTVSEPDSGYVLEAEDVVKYFRNGTQYQVSLKNGNGKPIAGEKIIVTFVNSKGTNPSQYTIITNENGTATLTINANPGIYYITATYANQSIVNKVTVLAITYSISAEDIFMTHKDGTKYTAKLTYNNGNPISNAYVSIILKSKNAGKEYKVLTDENGVAALPINLNPGQYTMTAKYMNEAITTKLVVLKGSYKIIVEDVVKYFKNGTQYTVKVTDLNGTPISGQNVTVTLNSGTWAKPAYYTITTDNNGIATLVINLSPGKYTATAKIGDDSVQSTISVLPTLTSGSLTKPVNQKGNLVAKLVDGQGNPLSGKAITFTVKTKTYTKITDVNGFAILPIGLGIGTWTINIADSETGAKTTAKVIITKART